MYKKALIAFDGSSGSLQAVELAKTMEAAGIIKDITVIHVATITLDTFDEYNIIGGKNESQTVNGDKVIAAKNAWNIPKHQIEKKLICRSQKIIASAKEIFEQAGLPVETVVKIGDPAEEILKYAEANNFKVIIMGSRGLSRFKEIVMGNVSNKILHKAKCQVIITGGVTNNH